MEHRHRLFLTALVPIALVIASCGEQDGEPPETQMMRALRTMEYRSERTTSGTVKLVDGQFREEAAPGSADPLTVRLAGWAVDDLNGDGKVDGAAVLETTGGEQGTRCDLVAVVHSKDGPKHVATASLGDAVHLESVRAENGWVTVDLLERAVEGPMATSMAPVKRTYRLVDNELVLTE